MSQKQFGSNSEKCLMTVTLNQLVEGTLVAINPQSDKTRKIIIKGFLSELLTKAKDHPHGFLVKLTSGEIGRVKEILAEAEFRGETDEPTIQEISGKAIEDTFVEGESHFVEFKTSCLWSQDLSRHVILQKGITQFGMGTSKVIIAKSIAGFLNADGGRLVIGVKEVKDTDDIEPVGIDSELRKLKDKTLDGYRRMILDSIIRKYLPSFVLNRINDYIRISFQIINGANICILTVLKSDKRVFLKLNGEDVFMVRVDASTRQITGNDLVEYCLTRF